MACSWKGGEGTERKEMSTDQIYEGKEVQAYACLLAGAFWYVGAVTAPHAASCPKLCNWPKHRSCFCRHRSHSPSLPS